MGTTAPESQVATPQPQKKYFVVSADCHVLEPPDLWERRIEAKFRHRLPKVEIDAKGNRVLVVEGARSLRIRDRALEGEDLERAKAGRPELETRLRDLDRDGIDAEVIYPNRGLLMWASPDPAHQTAMCKVWNDWALEFFAPQKQRCAPVAAVAPKDVETAVKEVERVAQLGYRTVFLPVQVQDQPYNLPLYDPLWAAIQETGMPISFHVGTGKDPRTATGNGGAIINYVWHALSTAIEPVVQLCASGVCERFPQLRFGTIEAGIGWLAWTLWVMDEGYKKITSGSLPNCRCCPATTSGGKGSPRSRMIPSVWKRVSGSASTTCCGAMIILIMKGRGRVHRKSLSARWPTSPSTSGRRYSASTRPSSTASRFLRRRKSANGQEAGS
jgi:predicted TIM-barrel fold metal-dependent hydrolase